MYRVIEEGRMFGVERKGAVLKTPAGADYIVPTRALAEAIVAEWEAQDQDKIKPDTMPLTQFAATSIDIVAKDPEKVVLQLASYAGSELLCHFATHPSDLVADQMKKWTPFLEWMAEKKDARLNVGEGVAPIVQTSAALKNVRDCVACYDPFFLTGLRNAVDQLGSVVLGLALIEGFANEEQVFEASEVECLYQMKRWGWDPEHVKRHESIKRELGNTMQWFRALRS